MSTNTKSAEEEPKPAKKIYLPPNRRNPQPETVGGDRPFKSFSRSFGDGPRREISNSNDHSGSYQRRDRFIGRGYEDRFSREQKYPSAWATRGDRRYFKENEDEIFDSMKTRTQAGINFNSYDNIPVQMTGRLSSTIHPIEDFQTGIHELLLANIKKVNYTKPTPIQKHSISVILANRDLMACAQTGSGKTAAFLLPIVTAMLKSGPPDSGPVANTYNSRIAQPVCLVLSPTRELAIQIYNEARKFNFGTGIRTVVLYGGSEVRRQLYDLDRGCDVCVATPGRLTDLLERRKISFTFVKYLVLDEADRMLDMGFAPQIRAIVDNNCMPKIGRQTVMFSATFPKEIQQLARDFLNDYIYLAVGRVGSTNEFIRQRLIYADQDQKPKYLVKLLKENVSGLVLIFVETKRRADMIEAYLQRENFSAVNIHGDRSQQDREHALRLFKTGEAPILVATDVAARGLDINNITHVINCDLPTNIDDYVHRIGRTGRAGNVGVATSLVNENNRPILKDLLSLLEEANQEIPPWFKKLVTSQTFGHYSSGGAKKPGKFNKTFSSKDMRTNSETVTYTHGGRGGKQVMQRPSTFQEFEDDWW
ncbi:DEAD box ATP-dependent RNA helicase family member protein [Theileria equi strain WA]|uniref:RNA helicase n=1 Tax=Theileria equi strain WA TaxID=1537102 RepID=L1LBK8_THEEQ|nr:DEAD box ATP-dependent RNA helicase family member protein [Theileria equi strain WA]EKX72655.1 DEAD box ATP-dependent RNA helicase family member protein [Theileria equi strain WA]|eukprot:XP_004832107.1 DEAD box ATP-dependent RNA helicase family member protein [Theileria equi strain WA]